MVSALPYDEDEKFWNEDYKETNGNRVPVFEYDYVAAKTFFQNRGIGRYRLLDTKLWTYIHLEPPVVRTIDVEDARDFMFAFAEQNCSRFVNNQLLKGGSQYVGPFQMSRLAFIQPNFISPSREPTPAPYLPSTPAPSPFRTVLPMAVTTDPGDANQHRA